MKININKQEELSFCTLGSGDVVERLGISNSTLYSYVSRGLVRVTLDPIDTRRKLYDRRDVENLYRRKYRSRKIEDIAADTINWGDPIIRTKISEISDGHFSYKGQNAIALSNYSTLEDILLLFIGNVSAVESDDSKDIDTNTDEPPIAKILYRLSQEARNEIATGKSTNPYSLLCRAVSSVVGSSSKNESLIHERLSHAWNCDSAGREIIRTAAVLSAEHELNPSTYTVRVAASAGASLAASLLAGVVTLSGTQHGGVSKSCSKFLDNIAYGPEHQSEDRARNEPHLNGFGHPLYPDGDPRAKVLLELCPPQKPWAEAIHKICETRNTFPNLDCALSVIERKLKLPAGAGLALFSISRMVGWIAHYYEQQKTGILIRPRAKYV